MAAMLDIDHLRVRAEKIAAKYGAHASLQLEHLEPSPVERGGARLVLSVYRESLVDLPYQTFRPDALNLESRIADAVPVLVAQLPHPLRKR